MRTEISCVRVGCISVLMVATLAGRAVVHGQGQEASPTPTQVQTRIPLWRCTLPGGIYEVALKDIIGVSTHSYIVDGAARVTELNIDTPGVMAVRFYYIEPLTAKSPLGIGQSTLDKAQDIVKEVGSRLSPDSQLPWEKVIKNYPTTTHAHTVEYRVESADQLDALFKSVDQAFRLNLNTQITLQ